MLRWFLIRDVRRHFENKAMQVALKLRTTALDGRSFCIVVQALWQKVRGLTMKWKVKKKVWVWKMHLQKTVHPTDMWFDMSLEHSNTRAGRTNLSLLYSSFSPVVIDGCFSNGKAQDRKADCYASSTPPHPYDQSDGRYASPYSVLIQNRINMKSRYFHIPRKWTEVITIRHIQVTSCTNLLRSLVYR